jgi:glycosyltransferase involved in cell wall biosynthesis
MKKCIIVGSYSSSLKNFRGDLIESLIDNDYDVFAAAPQLRADTETRNWLESRGVVCYDVEISRNGLNPWSEAMALKSLALLFGKVRPDLFIGYTAKPVVWGLLAAALMRVPGRVAIITGLGYAFIGNPRGRRKVIRSVLAKLYRGSLKYSMLTIFQNEDDRSDFIELGLLSPNSNQLIVNGSGVDIAKFVPVPFPNGPVKFLMIARLLGDKGIREYIEASIALSSMFPQVECHLVGGIDTNPNSIREHEVRAWHEAGSIIWHGEVTDVRPMIANTHVFVLPSYREGTPRTVLEAMAMGRPIITTAAPGCRETVVEGYNGFLVPVKDPVSLQLAMQKFIENNGIIEEMGNRSRIVAETKYNVQVVNRNILAGIDGAIKLS